MATSEQLVKEGLFKEVNFTCYVSNKKELAMQIAG